MAEYSREAEALARAMWGHDVVGLGRQAAQRAIDAGWQPPPNPWETIARSVWLFLFPGGEWAAPEFESHRDLVQYMREVFTAEEAQAIAGRIEGEPA